MGGKRVVTNSPRITDQRVTVIVASELMTAAGHGVASKWMSVEGVRVAVCAHCMATPSMPNATMGSMEPTKPTRVSAATPMPTTSAVRTASTPMPASTPVPATTPVGDCRSVRDDAKRANRNARCQKTYCFLLHGAFLVVI